MDILLVHALPGRVRLQISHLRGRSRALQALRMRIGSIPMVNGIWVNAVTGTVLICFDAHQITLPVLLRTLMAPPFATDSLPPVVLREVAATHSDDREMGLSLQQVRARQLRFGPNTIPDRLTPPVWRRFLGQFTDLGSVILLAGTGLAVLTGRVGEAVAVGAVALTGALIGTWRAGQQDRAITLLQRLAPPHATTIRQGRLVVVPARELVPGDILLLRAGDRLPADVQVLTAVDLQVDDRHLLGAGGQSQQAILPGQYLPVGIEVLRGRARAEVTATGAHTEIGRIVSTMERVKRVPSPVELRMAGLARDVLKVAVIAFAIVTLSGLLRGMSVLQMLQSGVGIATAAIPEGMPTFITLALAAGARRLARRGAYVRSLAAAHGLGDVDVICTDKTGTLTQGEMTVRVVYTGGGERWTVTGVGFDLEGQFLCAGEVAQPLDDPDMRTFLELAIRCNDATMIEGADGEMRVDGSQTEGALRVLALKAGLPGEIGREPRLEEETFDPIRRRMTVTLDLNETARITCSKGAPEEILPLCREVLAGGVVRALNGDDRTAIERTIRTMTASAYRVIALAYASGDHMEGPGRFIFAGLAGILDPPRSELRPIIRRCEERGIRTVMLTGDHPDTASAVARELGMLSLGRQIVTGTQLRKMADIELSRILDRIGVFARVTPAQKVRVIRALQHRGHRVAYIGDGIDDVPAIRAADTGAAPREGSTDAAREAASVIIADHRFETLVTAMEQGGTTAANLDDISTYLLTANTSEILVLLAAAVFGMPMPLLPLQLLWLNLIADSPVALVLAERHARASASGPFRTGRGVRALEREIVVRGVEIGLPAFGLFATTLARTGSLPLARSMALSSLAIGQTLSLFRCRTEIDTPCGLWLPAEPVVGMAAGVTGLLLIGTLYVPPLAGALGTVPLAPGQWLTVLGAALAANISSAAGFSLVRYRAAEALRQQNLRSPLF